MKVYISPIRSRKQVKITFSKSDKGSNLGKVIIYLYHNFNKGYRITHKDQKISKILNTVHKIMRNF